MGDSGFEIGSLGFLIWNSPISLHLENGQGV